MYMLRKKEFVAITSALIMTACSSSSNIENHEQKHDKYTKLSGLYGYLDKNADGEYHFTKFATQLNQHDHYKPWVTLETMTPYFETSVHRCSTSNYTSLCGAKENLLFRDGYVSASDVGVNATFWTLGTFMTAVTFGILAPMMIENAKAIYTTDFDEDDFNQALAEAKTKTDLNLIGDEYENYTSWLAKRKAEYQKEVTDKHLALSKSLEFKLIDKSQLLRNKITSNAVYISKPNTNKSLVAKGHYNSFDSMKEEIEKDIVNRISYINFKVNCDKSKMADYIYSTQGCDNIFTMKSKVPSIPVVYTVKKQKAFKVDYFPSLEDDKIKLSSNGYNINATNKTNSFLHIKTLSIYVGDDIETRKHLSVEVPPRAVVSVARNNDFSMTQKRLVLNSVTKRDVQRKMNIGAALKYVVVDTNKEKTLFNIDDIVPLQYN